MIDWTEKIQQKCIAIAGWTHRKGEAFVRGNDRAQQLAEETIQREIRELAEIFKLRSMGE